MRVRSALKRCLDAPALRRALVPLVKVAARAHNNGMQQIFLDGDLWIHQTAHGFFAYHEPYIRLDLRRLDQLAQRNFFWGCKLQAGDVVVDVGAGAGEDTLSFSRAVGPGGKVVCIEAHPKTCLCLRATVRYNRLENVVVLHRAVVEPGRTAATIETSSNYLMNRLGGGGGTTVPSMTMDAIHDQLRLGDVKLLKMNIEGAERLAILGMNQTLKRTNVVCICCHDFLADKTGDESYRTRRAVWEFLAQNHFKIVERNGPALPAYLRDQLWAYNEKFVAAVAG